MEKIIKNNRKSRWRIYFSGFLNQKEFVETKTSSKFQDSSGMSERLPLQSCSWIGATSFSILSTRFISFLSFLFDSTKLCTSLILWSSPINWETCEDVTVSLVLQMSRQRTQMFFHARSAFRVSGTSAAECVAEIPIFSLLHNLYVFLQILDTFYYTIFYSKSPVNINIIEKKIKKYL